MKKIALILAAIFLIGALTGTITIFAKGKGSATPKDESGSIIAGGGSSSGGSSLKPSGSGTATVIPSSDPTFSSAIAKETLRQQIDFSTPFTPNQEANGWALWSDRGFTVTQSAGNLTVKNTLYSYLGNDGVDTKCDFTFRMSKDYNRNDPHFSASFDLLGSTAGTLNSTVFISLEEEAGTYETANLLRIRNNQLYAVDKDKGDVKLADISSQSALKISYHVDMLEHKVQIWIGTRYAGEFTLDTGRTDDKTANQYFAFYCAPDIDNTNREITLDNIKIYY